MERQRGYCLARSILGENSTKFRRHSSSKLENHISLLEANKKKKKENQKSLKMKPNAKPLSLISHICLALVILMFDAALNVSRALLIVVQQSEKNYCLPSVEKKSNQFEPKHTHTNKLGELCSTGYWKQQSLFISIVCKQHQQSECPL